MVGADGAAAAADAGDVVAGADVLRAAQGQQVAELGVRAVVDDLVAFHRQDLAVFVGGHLDVDEERRAFAGVLHVLLVIVFQVNRALGGHAGHAEQGFHGRAELVAKGAAGRVLNQAQLVRLDAQAGGDHVQVQVQADALGVNGQAALLIEVGKAHVRFDGQVRLALEIETVLDHIRRRFHDRLGVRALDDLLLEVDIGRAGVDFDGVVGHGRRGAHVGGQLFQFHFDLFGGGLGLLDGVGADDGNRVAILEDLRVAQNRAIPAITLVGREGDQAGDAVLALDILVRDDFEDAGHLLGFGGVDRQDVGVRDLGLHQRQLQRAGGHLQAEVLAVVQRAGDFGRRRSGADICCPRSGHRPAS